MDLSDLRRDFGKFGLDDTKLPEHPVDLFTDWLQQAKNAEIPEANAMVLSTVDIQGKPASRIVLLKELNDNGLIFYTNYHSRKGKEIRTNAHVAINFFWRELEMQIRIEGKVHKTNLETSEKYFKSRPLESQLSAIVSPQSETIDSLKGLKKKAEDLFVSGKKINMPDYWGGYIISPGMYEFWQGGKNRFHDRILYSLKDGKWSRSRLAP